MRVLITGISGFVGSYLTKALLAKGYEVFGFCYPAGAPELDALGARIISVPLGERIGDVARSVADIRPDFVFHLAALSSVPEAEADFARVTKVNVVGTYEIVKACIDLNLPLRFVLVSSGEVHRGLEQHDSVVTVDERSVYAPQNNYGLSKVLAEEVLSRFRSSGVSFSVFRPFNHIGPGQSDRFVVSSFARQLALIKLGRRDPEIRVGNLEAERDFLDVRDVIQAYLRGMMGPPGVYVLGSGEVVRIRRVLDMLIGISGCSVRVEVDPARLRSTENRRGNQIRGETTGGLVSNSDAHRFRGVAGRSALAQMQLGWEPKFRLETSLQDVFDYWLSHEQDDSKV